MYILLRYTVNLLTCIIVPHYYYITYSTLLNYVNLTLFFMGPPLVKIWNTQPNEMKLCPDLKYH